MIKIIMIRVIIKIGIDQIAEIEGHHSEVEVRMNRIVGKDSDTSIILEMTILKKCKTIEVKVLQMDIEGIIETTALVEVGLGKNNI